MTENALSATALMNSGHIKTTTGQFVAGAIVSEKMRPDVNGGGNPASGRRNIYRLGDRERMLKHGARLGTRQLFGERGADAL